MSNLNKHKWLILLLAIIQIKKLNWVRDEKTILWLEICSTS